MGSHRHRFLLTATLALAESWMKRIASFRRSPPAAYGYPRRRATVWGVIAIASAELRAAVPRRLRISLFWCFSKSGLAATVRKLGWDLRAPTLARLVEIRPVHVRGPISPRTRLSPSPSAGLRSERIPARGPRRPAVAVRGATERHPGSRISRPPPRLSAAFAPPPTCGSTRGPEAESRNSFPSVRASARPTLPGAC